MLCSLDCAGFAIGFCHNLLEDELCRDAYFPYIFQTLLSELQCYANADPLSTTIDDDFNSKVRLDRI